MDGVGSEMLKQELNLWNKNEKMFQIDLDSDLKEEPDLKGRCWFTLFRPVMKGSWICLNLIQYALMWVNIFR